MQVKYSIIIPSHNHPELLSRCLNSIPDIAAIQVIVIDDNSDPKKVCFEQYPGLERAFTEVVFTKEGKGAGYARNVGLSKAKGKWILFADSDDFFTDKFISVIDNFYESQDDIIFFDVTSVYSENMEPSLRHLSRSHPLKSLTGAKLLSFCRHMYTEPWGKMFRASFLYDIEAKFDESFCANDYYFSVYTACNTNKIAVAQDVLYCVTERKGSLSNSFSGDEKRLKTRLEVYKKVQDYYQCEGIKLYPLYDLIAHTLLRQRNSSKAIFEYCKTNRLSYCTILYFYFRGKLIRSLS